MMLKTKLNFIKLNVIIGCFADQDYFTTIADGGFVRDKMTYFQIQIFAHFYFMLSQTNLLSQNILLIFAMINND